MNNEYRDRFISWKRNFENGRFEISSRMGSVVHSDNLMENRLEKGLKAIYPAGHDIKGSIERARRVFADEWVAEWRDYYFVENLKEVYSLSRAINLILRIIKRIKL